MDLNRATTFVRVVEAGGFTRAAATLGLPPSSVSRAVQKLEGDLGVTLLERTTRSVTLTEAGRAFFERAREALAGLAEANELALDAAREVHGVVRLAVPPELGGRLGTILGPFAAQHPRVRIEVTFTARGAELVGDLVDLALVVGRLPDSSLVTRRLGESIDKLYASPGYVREHGAPRRAAELAKHEAVLARAVAGEGHWELTGPRGAEHVTVHGRIVGDHLQLVVDAALAGLGIALVPQWVGDPLVAAKKLVAILPQLSSTTALHLLTPGAKRRPPYNDPGADRSSTSAKGPTDLAGGRHLPRRVALLRDHLFDALSRTCGEHAR